MKKRQKIIAGNWKMNGSHETNATLIHEIAAYREQSQKAQSRAVLAQCLVFPPSIYLESVKNLINRNLIDLGAQNISQYSNGAYTGEISTSMLQDIGCRYVLIGHSERRTLFGETNAIVAEKFLAAKKAGLTPVLCVGETLAQRQADQAEAILAEQLAVIADWKNAIIAYEPVWAIGTGLTATPEQAQTMHEWIRQCVAQKDPEIAQKISILYGGSVKASNAKTLLAMPDIDGALVGGASLIADEFIAILEATATYFQHDSKKNAN